MPTGPSIEASFGLNLAPLKRGFTEAEAIAKAGSGRVARAIVQPSVARSVNWQGVNALSNTFGARERDIAERARRNSAAGFAPARPGQYLPVADEAAAARRGGRGAFGVVGAASAVAGVSAIVSVYKTAIDEIVAFRKSTSGALSSGGNTAFRTAGDIESKFGASISGLQAFRDRGLEESQGAIGKVQRFRRQLTNKTLGAGTFAEQDAADEQTKIRLREQASKAVGDLASKQTKLNSAEAKGLFFSERQAALDKEAIEHKERLGALAEKEALSGVAGTPLQDAEKTRTALANIGIDRQFSAQEKARNLAAGIQSISEGAARGAITSRTANLGILRARQRSASARALEGGLSSEEGSRRQAASREANLAVFEGEFQQSEAMRGPAGADLRRGERAEGRRRSAFFANQKDASERRGRGARDQVALGDTSKGDQSILQNILSELQGFAAKIEVQ